MYLRGRHSVSPLLGRFDRSENICRYQSYFIGNHSHICLSLSRFRENSHGAFTQSFIGRLFRFCFRHTEHIRVRYGKSCVLDLYTRSRNDYTQKDIFRPYYSENASEDNVGLGLYLCKKTIEAMNGELSYEQNEQGLTFIISLPTIE